MEKIIQEIIAELLDAFFRVSPIDFPSPISEIVFRDSLIFKLVELTVFADKNLLIEEWIVSALCVESTPRVLISQVQWAAHCFRQVSRA